jgi:hypothetical protein
VADVDQTDPSLSLDAWPRGGTQAPGAAAAGGNPLALVGQFADIQNKVNQNRMFQQTFAARQRAGQIIAASPDLETAFQSLTKDPQVAPFAGPIINEYRQGMLSQLQYQGEQSAQARSGFEGVLKALPAALADPSQLGPAIQQQTALMSPAARAKSAPAIASLVSALTDGLPQDPAQARQLFNQRLTGQMISAGVTPDAVKGIVGSMTTMDLGGQKVPGVQLPPQLGGGFVPGGKPLQMSLPPTLTTGPYGEGGATKPVIVGGASGGNALTPGGSKAAAGSGLAISGPSQEQTEANQRAGAAGGDIAGEMIARGEALPGAIKRLDMMTDALSNFQSGGGAQMRSKLGTALQAVKNAGGDFISDDLIQKVANSSLPDTQVFSAEIKPLVIGQLKEAAQGTGRVMRSEVDAFLQMMDASKDPQTLMRLLNQGRYALQVGYDQSQKYVDFKQAIASKDPSVKGLGPSDFFSWYNKNFKPEALPPSNAGGGLNLAQTPISNAKGAAPAKRWRIENGKLVPDTPSAPPP